MWILALDSALGRCSCALVVNEQVFAERAQDAVRGQAALLPVMVQEVLDLAGVGATNLDLIAVTVGPGSFTGIRAGLALSHGIALAAGIPLIGVTVGEALAAAALPSVGGRQVWSAIDSRRGRIFLEIDGSVMAHALADLPKPPGPIAVTGDASVTVMAWLAARDFDVMLTSARFPRAADVAAVAAQRYAGNRTPVAAQPLYVDPPEARHPAGGLRPPPRA